MKLTADNLVMALTACCGEQPDGRAETLALMRQAQPSFAATLQSAWQAEFDDLNPGLRHDLDAARKRIDYYRSVAARLVSHVPGLIPIKGLEVADLYPDGLVRAMNDLDYVATEPDLWSAVAALIEDGWSLDTATFAHFDGSLQVMVSLRRPPDDPYLLPYGVEIATYYTLGNLGGIAPVLRIAEPWRTPRVKNMLMLLYERFEQPYRARDLIDAALLTQHLKTDELAALTEAVVRLGLRPEYAELARLVDRAGLGSLPVPVTHAWTGPLTRARRIARGAGFFRRPIVGVARHLQRRIVSGKSRKSRGWAWAAAQWCLPVASAVRAGVLGFGLPLDGVPSRVEVAALHRRGRLAWVDTPVARFLLTIGDDVTQAAVDELSGPVDTAVAAAAVEVAV